MSSTVKFELYISPQSPSIFFSFSFFFFNLLLSSLDYTCSSISSYTQTPATSHTSSAHPPTLFRACYQRKLVYENNTRGTARTLRYCRCTSNLTRIRLVRWRIRELFVRLGTSTLLYVRRGKTFNKFQLQSDRQYWQCFSSISFWFSSYWQRKATECFNIAFSRRTSHQY